MTTLLHEFLQGFKDVGETIALVVNATLLMLAYVVGIGLAQAFSGGKEWLETKLDDKRTTYWESHDRVPTDVEKYWRQF
jgi:hypothetical protein